MYNRRVKIFVIFSLLLLAVCLLRLAQMQLLTASSVQHEIAELKQQRGQSRQLQTIRGRILDRNGKVLAMDEARFWVHINYNLSSFLDERVRKSMLAGAAARRDADVAVAKVDEEIREKLEDLQLIIEKCTIQGGRTVCDMGRNSKNQRLCLGPANVPGLAKKLPEIRSL